MVGVFFATTVIFGLLTLRYYLLTGWYRNNVALLAARLKKIEQDARREIEISTSAREALLNARTVINQGLAESGGDV